jgi:membrane-bound lytic murein transglycosylase A
MAPKASSSSKVMLSLLQSAIISVAACAIVGTLAGCGSVALQTPPTAPAPGGLSVPAPQGNLPAPQDEVAPSRPTIAQIKSRWVAVPWAELPGFADDPLNEAWNAWIKSCEKPLAPWAVLCGDVRRLSIATPNEQRQWLQRSLQPYRVEGLQAPQGEGLLTAYYEPVLEAARKPDANFKVPLYQPPLNLAQKKPWYTRQEIDTLPAAQAALRGREIAYLADPVDALVLQIQGSGRLRVTQADGSKVTTRVAYAGTNDQPYKSVGRWLLDQGAIKDATWPGIKAWTLQNPKRVQEMIWSNPRTVFFREEPLPEGDAAPGPKGAQGVALTAGRSIAVDPGSIPYGTPVWLASSGPQVNLQRLVMAQDTGSAIVGAVRADYFAGSGLDAGELAGRVKQPLRLWVLWPK